MHGGSNGWRVVTEPDAMHQVLTVLDARIRVLEVRLAHEMRLKDDLRAQQVAIHVQEEELIASLQERSAAAPASFRQGEMRLQKLVMDQRALQPVLARAAIQRADLQEQLRQALRQRLGVTHHLARQPVPDRSDEAETLALRLLFEMRKTR